MESHRSIFPILAFDIDIQKFLDIENGTGFFINNEGWFISAGHIFNDRRYYANINDKQYLLHVEFIEYKDQLYQRPPLYFDLVIGKVLGYLENIEPLKFSTKQEPNSTYNVCGYSSREFMPFDKKISSIELDDLYDSDLNDDLPPVNYFEPQYQFIKNKMFILEKNGKGYSYENGFQLDMGDTLPFGLSGGPAMFNGKVMGMLVRQHNCISSEYITEQLVKRGIDYNT